MENPAVSPIQMLNAAIQSHNPFINGGIVKEQDVWGKKFLDVPTLHAHASDAIFQAIELVRNSKSTQDKVTSIAITAPPGVGKTHVLSRIRHRLECSGSAFFVFAGVNNYTELAFVKYKFQQTLAYSLSHTGSQGLMQWQEVAAAIANEGFKAINNNAPSLSPQELINRFDRVCASWSVKNKNLMSTLTKQVLKTKPNADPYIVRAILWTLSESQASFAIKWLSGEELAQSNADSLGLPNPSKTSQDREAEALKTVQQILNLVSYYNPIVICFDEIDVKNNSTDDGLPTELVIADLVKRLHDTLEQSEISRGVVILTVMQPDTWGNTVNCMPGGIPDRVSKYTQRRPIVLQNISGDSLVELITLWLKDFYEARKLVPPSPVYPFEESQLREYGKVKPTVREALKWCAEKFKVYEEPLPPEPHERFQLALKRENEAEIGDDLENNSLIAEALYFGFVTLKGEILDGETSTGEKLNKVKIEDITEVTQKAPNNGYINFKIIAFEKEKTVKIGVSVIQSKSVLSALKRLTEYQKFDINRGCLLRSKSKKINNRGEAYKLLEHLVSNLGGEWVDLKAEEIRPLFNLYSLYQKRDRYQLSKEQIIDYSKSITLNNNLLREILSDPSGEIDEQTIEEDTKLIDDFLNPSNIEDTNNADALSELFN
jgi:hypothetical protein